MGKNICLILARSGSKGLLNKNILKINDFNLIEWAYYAAKDASYIDEIILSTNYPREYFSNLDLIYYKRSEELCSDYATSYDAIIDIINKLESKIGNINTITLLEPPCPFRDANLLNNVFSFFKSKAASSVVTVKKVNDHHPIRMKKLTKDNLLLPIDENFTEPNKGFPRQLQNNLYIRDTAIYLFDTWHLKNNIGGLYGSKNFGYINNSITCNIDNNLDFIYAKFLLNEYLKKEIDINIPTFIKKKIIN